MRSLTIGLSLVLLGLLAAAPAHARGRTGRTRPAATGITIPRGSWDARLQGPCRAPAHSMPWEARSVQSGHDTAAQELHAGC